MKTNVYSVFDTKAAVYGTPFFMPNDAMASRAFADLVNDENTLVSRHPEDFTLFYVGEFDDSIGVIKSETPVGMCTASSVKRVVERNGTKIPVGVK